MAWTDERIQLLRQYWEEGRSASQIAELLGEGLSRNAVIGKAHRLGLSARPSPLKASEGRHGTKANGSAAADPWNGAAAPEPEPATAAASAHGSSSGDGHENGRVASAVEPAAAPVADAPAASLAEALEPLPARPTAAPAAQKPAPRPGAATPAARTAKPGRVTLLDLNDRICRWPIGHPDEPDFHFCGKPVSPGFPYCGEHCLLAYQAQMPRKDRPAGPSRPFGPNLPRPR